VLSDILQIFTGLEANRPSRRDANFFACPGIPSDASFAWFHLEDAKASQLDAVTTLHRQTHRVEHGIDRNLGLDLGDVRDLRDLVDDVDLDHA
jgi:hypothetical protein